MPRFVNALSASLLLIGTSFASAQTAPTLTPALPPTIDKVLALPPLSLKCKGMSANHALAAWCNLAGATVVPAKYQDTGRNGPRPLLDDSWFAAANQQIDSDLEGVSFWQGMYELMKAAQVRVRAIGNNTLTVYPGFSESNNQFTPAACMELGVSMRHDVEIHMTLDPRIRLCALGEPVVQSARTDKGQEIAANATTSGTWEGAELQHRITWKADQPPSSTLATFAGYLPCQVVTSYKETPIPLVKCAHATVDGWTVTLSDFGDETLPLRQRGTFVDVSFKPPAGVPASLLVNLPMLVELHDDAARPLKPVASGEKSTADSQQGTVHQRVSFYQSLYSQDGATASILFVLVPTEIKPAIIPFSFGQVKLY